MSIVQYLSLGVALVAGVQQALYRFNMCTTFFLPSVSVMPMALSCCMEFHQFAIMTSLYAGYILCLFP